MATGIENLKLDKLTPEERREITSRGGKKSAEARKRKKNIQQCMKSIMDLNVPESALMDKVRKNLSLFGLESEDMTYAAAISAMMIQKALQGNVRAAEFVRDTGGFNPDVMLRKEIFKHEKEMDKIRLGQEDVKKNAADTLIAALENTDVEDAE